MASIRKHGDGWQARVRRNGFPVEIKTFPTKLGAEQWARTIESKMDGGQFVSHGKSEKTTFGDVIRRYMTEITPEKRGCLEETMPIRSAQVESSVHGRICACWALDGQS